MAVPPRYKFKLFTLFMLAYGVFYVYPNFLGAHAVQLPLLPIDRAIPLIPWSFLIYTSDYFLFLMVIIMVKDLEPFNDMSRKFFIVLFISGTIFWIYPTEYPRPEYPLVDNWLVSFWMSLIKLGDTPRNCFPSMHVALTGIATWSIRYRGPRVFWSFVVWSLAIFASTLTTKQHYFVDILGGIAVIAISILCDGVLQRYEILKKVPVLSRLRSHLFF